MPISVQCKCGKTLKAKDETAGAKARCPGCNEILIVPFPNVPDPDRDAFALATLQDEDEKEQERPARSRQIILPQEEHEDDSPAPRTYARKLASEESSDIDPHPDRPVRKAPMKRKRVKQKESKGGFSLNLNSEVVTGLLMMVAPPPGFSSP